MPHQDRLNIAVFIDFDNIEIGVKTTLGQQFDVGIILDAIKERGEVVTKIAYADWTRSGEYSRSLTQHAIRLVQRNMTPGGDKNGADINLALDALEMAFTHQHINAYVIVGGDSDFLSLVEKLKQYDKKVFVVGGRAFTSMILQRNCHEFIAYENLAGVRKNAAKIGRPMPAAAASSPMAQAVPIVRRALKILADREVSPQTGLLKSTLLQLDSTFSERNYGASSFLDFVEKLSQAGHRQPQARRPQRDGGAERRRFGRRQRGGGAVSAGRGDGDVAAPRLRTATSAAASDGGARTRRRSPTSRRCSGPPKIRRRDTRTARPRPPCRGTLRGAPDRERRSGRAARRPDPAAAMTARWPMYLRNVKQILRQAEGGFDERRYGFGGLMDLLKACQREGFVRIERDRRGGLRVFQGAALQKTAVVPSTPREIVDVEPIEAQPRESRSKRASRPTIEQPEMEPIPIDTTAELLGRAKPRKPRARAPRQAAATPTPRPSTRPRRRRRPGRQNREEGRGAAPGDDAQQEGGLPGKRRQRQLSAGDELTGDQESSGAVVLQEDLLASDALMFDALKDWSSYDDTDVHRAGARGRHRIRPRFNAQTRADSRPLQPDDIFSLKSVGDPRISPDGAWIAYTVTTLDRKEDNSDTDLYMVAASGGAPVRLTSSKKPENAPRWSPDGRYLAFLSARDGKKPQVFLLDRRGGDAQAITDYKTGASAIAWSPDSSKLALLVSDPDPNDPEASDATAARSKKPKPHVITRLQFMRDGDGYLNDVKRHIHVFDIATKADLAAHVRSLRRRRAGVGAGRHAHRLQREPHRQSRRQRQQRHLRHRAARRREASRA